MNKRHEAQAKEARSADALTADPSKRAELNRLIKQVVDELPKGRQKGETEHGRLFRLSSAAIERVEREMRERGKDEGSPPSEVQVRQFHWLQQHIEQLTEYQDELEAVASRLSELRLETASFTERRLWRTAAGDDHHDDAAAADKERELAEQASELQGDVSRVVAQLAYLVRVELYIDTLNRELVAIGLDPRYTGERIVNARYACATYLEDEPDERDHLLGVSVTTTKWLAGLRLRVARLLSLLRSAERDYRMKVEEKAKSALPN